MSTKRRFLSPQVHRPINGTRLLLKMRFLTSYVFICPPVFCVFSFCFLSFRFLCTGGFLCCFNISFLACFLWVFLILRAILFHIEAQTTLKLSFLSQEKHRFLSQRCVFFVVLSKLNFFWFIVWVFLILLLLCFAQKPGQD